MPPMAQALRVACPQFAWCRAPALELHRRPRPRTYAAQSEGQAADDNPFHFGFQCNERYLQWDESAQRRLLKLYVAKEMDQTVEWVDGKLLELAQLLPDLVFKLERLKADLVLHLVADMPGVTSKLVRLKAALPAANVSDVVARYPWLLTGPDMSELESQVERLREALPGVNVCRLVESEPMLLRADIGFVLEEIRRLLPGQDPVAVLCLNPGMVIDMGVAQLPASLEIDDGIKAP